MLPSLRALPCHVCPEQTLDRLLAANARARRLALAAASRRGVVAVIAAQRLTGPAAWLALAVHAKAVTR